MWKEDLLLEMVSPTGILVRYLFLKLLIKEELLSYIYLNLITYVFCSISFISHSQEYGLRPTEEIPGNDDIVEVYLRLTKRGRPVTKCRMREGH